MLAKAHSFKDKSDRLAEVNAGLFIYPVLMAADILLYDATHVPVGDDQKQHLELCRDIAQKFNNDFYVENFFRVPEPLIQKEFSRIMSLKDGSKKMIKSELSDLIRINLTDDKDKIIKEWKMIHRKEGQITAVIVRQFWTEYGKIRDGLNKKCSLGILIANSEYNYKPCIQIIEFKKKKEWIQRWWLI